MTSPAFATYVEGVFRHQNEVATELAFEMELEEWGSERYGRLEAAEAQLLDACAGLNELANRQRDGRSVRGPAAARRARGAADCERAALRAERALDDQNDSE